MGMTMAEKALARASGRNSVDPGEFVTAKIDLIMMHDQTFWAGYEAILKGVRKGVWDADRIVMTVDHGSPARNLSYSETHVRMRQFADRHGIRNFYDVGTGICHQLLPEKGHVLPGQLIVGADSHTTTYGAFGAASCGIGGSEVAYVLSRGSLWFMVPETIRFILKGTLPMGTSGKDILLRIAGQYSCEVAQYRAIEFAGPGAGALDISDRMTICNMGVDIGAKFAFFQADEKALSYLRARTDQPLAPFAPDSDASYRTTYELDVSVLEPLVACPHNQDNVKSVSELGDVPVHQAFLGSCTNGRLEDLEKAAAILKGRKVNPRTRLLVLPASREIFLQALKSGILETLMEAGAVIGPPTCGPCGGAHLGLLGPGENAISATNRNFKGSMGSKESFVYLGSAETVAASAIEGKIADPRKYLKQ